MKIVINKDEDTELEEALMLVYRLAMENPDYEKNACWKMAFENKDFRVKITGLGESSITFKVWLDGYVSTKREER